jgi:subtilase family serine protease
MWRTIASRRTLVSPAAIILLLVALMGSYLLISRAASTNQPFITVPGSALSLPTNAKLQGQHATSDQLLISVVLHPNNEAQMNALLASLYDPSSSQYQHWLSTGQFNSRFAPTAAQIAQVQNFLTQAGLQVVSSSTPFLVRAVGTTPQIESAFHTTLKDYRKTSGKAPVIHPGDEPPRRH